MRLFANLIARLALQKIHFKNMVREEMLALTHFRIHHNNVPGCRHCEVKFK